MYSQLHVDFCVCLYFALFLFLRSLRLNNERSDLHLLEMQRLWHFTTVAKKKVLVISKCKCSNIPVCPASHRPKGIALIVPFFLWLRFWTSSHKMHKLFYHQLPSSSTHIVTRLVLQRCWPARFLTDLHCWGRTSCFQKIIQFNSIIFTQEVEML